MKTGHRIAVWSLFVAAPLALIGYKIAFLGYSLGHVIPWKAYQVRLDMSFDGHGDSVDIRTYLPLAEKRQHFWDESIRAEGLSQQASYDAAGNHGVRLTSAGLSGPRPVRVEFKVLGEQNRYVLDEALPLEKRSTPYTEAYLDSTQAIPTGHPEIIALLDRLGTRGTRVLPVIRATFAYATDSIRYRNFSGTTEALTTLRLGEASCNGKSRLLAALLRTAGIPTRLVGGLILEKGSKRTTHQWLEAYLAGFWVPFCPTNRHFAEIPENYLVLYRGDEILFRHSANINFNYRFDIQPVLVSKDEIGLGKDQLGSMMDMWDVFNRAGLSLAVLKVLLLMPIGGLVTVIFRNIIGLEPFGTFLPALIALAARETGLIWGMLSFFLVIGICAIMRGLLEGLKITHTPKLAIIMIFVVGSMLALTYAGLTLDQPRLVYVSLFPIVVLTMTVERFSRTIVEDGMPAALKRAGVTALALPCCYAILSFKVLALFLMAFPEAMLLLVALNIWVGRWAGIRVMEYWRFRHFLFQPGKTPAQTGPAGGALP